MEISGERIDGLQVCRRAPVVSHLLVADDSLLFFRANGTQAVAVKCCLAGYYKGTGQQNKFSILFNSKQSLEVMETIMESLAIHTITFEAKYLGLPTPEGRLKVNKFQANLKE